MQGQLLLDRQKLEIRQSVINSLGMFLAIAEGYLIAKGINMAPKFAHYDHFYITKDTPELIKLKLLNNYHIFMAQKSNYLNIYNKYDFYPNNLPVEDIKKIVESWIPFAEYIKEGKLYKDILLLFYEDECRKYQTYFNEIKNIKNNQIVEKNQFVHPLDQAKTIALIYKDKDEQMKRNEEKWKKQSIPTIDIVIGGEAGTSELSKKLNSKTTISEKEIIEKMKIEEEMNKRINDLFFTSNTLIETTKRDEKNNLRKEIKEKTKELKNIIQDYLEKYRNLEGLWILIKPEVIQENCKKYKSKVKKEHSHLFDDIYNLFFEDENEDGDMS